MSSSNGPCQIYLCVPGDCDRAQLDALLRGGGLDHVASVLLRRRPDGQCDHALAEQLKAATHGRDIPVVIEADIASAKDLGLDGVHVGDSDDAEQNYDLAREKLANDAIVGVSCGISRHTALSVAERGADYVAFSGAMTDAVEDMIAWWSQVTIVPCVALDVGDADMAGRLADAGADFIAVEGFVWSGALEPAEAIEQLVARLAMSEAAA